MKSKITNAQSWIQAAVNDARSIEQNTDSIREQAAARSIIADLHNAFEALAKVSHQLPAIGVVDEPTALKAVE
jgi:hypothetical protein